MAKKNTQKTESIRLSSQNMTLNGANIGGSGNTASYNSVEVEIDAGLSEISKELSTLLEAMRKDAKSTDHFIDIGNVANAQKAAEENNQQGVVSNLSKSGKWVLDVAQKIGVSLVTKVLQNAIGL
ncbi:MAG: hypothetical protein WA949_08390 [Phormidesmis sp.]